MSLVDGAEPTCEAAVARLVADLMAGSPEDQAVLLNLREEDRVPDSRRAAFHSELVAVAVTKKAVDRIWDAAQVAFLVLPVPSPRPPALGGTWRTYVTLRALQKYGYVRKVTRPRSPPPRRLRLERPIGRPEAGADLFFWVTPKESADADELRDRLGLGHMADGEELYRIEIPMAASPARPLHIPTALDSRANPRWRRPPSGHKEPWGLTRDLRTDDAAEPELLARPHAGDPLEARHVGRIRRVPSTGYLARRTL